MLEIVQIPVLTDNYIYLLHDPEADVTAVVDPAEAAPVLATLEARGWTLDLILNTHHHGDHVGGNLALKTATGCRIIGPAADTARIPGIDEAVAEGDTVSVGASTARVFDIPGHTRGHIAYYFAADEALFCGDTLFAMGCGRLFEGTPYQMVQSLAKFAPLPGTTRVYCAHEYTENNGRFALDIEPRNATLTLRMRGVQQMRAEGRPTIPTTLAEERATNPFLRCEDSRLKRALGMEDANPVDVFAELRARKDNF